MRLAVLPALIGSVGTFVWGPVPALVLGSVVVIMQAWLVNRHASEA